MNRTLANVWTGIALLLCLFTLYALFVQVKESNPLEPVVTVGLLALASGAGAFALHRAQGASWAFVTGAGLLSLMCLIMTPVMAWGAQTDDAPGLMVLALLTLTLGLVSGVTALKTGRAIRRTDSSLP